MSKSNSLNAFYQEQIQHLNHKRPALFLTQKKLLINRLLNPEWVHILFLFITATWKHSFLVLLHSPRYWALDILPWLPPLAINVLFALVASSKDHEVLLTHCQVCPSSCYHHPLTSLNLSSQLEFFLSSPLHFFPVDLTLFHLSFFFFWRSLLLA